MPSYLDKLQQAQTRNTSWLCIGLDPDPARLQGDILTFNKKIIDATADLVSAYKPNLGFYLQWGAAGVTALEQTIAHIPEEIPVILDCKAGDIGHTQAAWAMGLFDLWKVDAITVNPYIGSEAILPMIGERPSKAVYILARTSNRSAMDFQGKFREGEGLTAVVIQKSQRWHSDGHKGYVVGATYPEELAIAREMAPQANFLIPGIGAQGGNLETAVKYGSDAQCGPVISSSRGIIYAESGIRFAEAAREAAVRLRGQINELR